MRFRGLRGRRSRPIVVYHPAYRWPLTGLEATFDPRRADLVSYYLLDCEAIRPADIVRPTAASYDDLALVHSPDYLERLTRPESLAAIFSLDPSEVRVDPLMWTVRLACGGTLAAARAALSDSSAALNLLGGFHHAAPSCGGGFCAVNDIAIAIARLRRDGFSGRIAVLDLDAHPPDGTAECLRSDSAAWIGSLSGPGWPEPFGIDAIPLPRDCSDSQYLTALDALLGRMPPVDLAFVIAGGDVLAEDRFGKLGLSLDGARERDARVLEALRGRPSVWLPGGGYHRDSWRVLAGTALVLAGRRRARIRRSADPLRSHFAAVAAELGNETFADLSLSEEDLGLGALPFRLLGFYSREAVEHALSRYGLWSHIERLGYAALRVDIDTTGTGDRFRLFGTARGEEHLLVEVVLERRRIAERDVLFVHWLTLRDPLARFTDARPRLPGQDAPGLGLSRETTELLLVMARRLGLDGVGFRPSWFHTAFAARRCGRFVDPARQGRFEAQLRDLAAVPLLEATEAFASGRVRMDGRPYAWEPDEMVAWLTEPPTADPDREAEGSRHRFSIDEKAQAAG